MTPESRIESFWGRAAETFVIGSALLSLLGWTLALTQQLKPVPYAVGLALTMAILFGLIVRRRTKVRSTRPEFYRLKRRLHHHLFAVFFFIWLAALIGGLLYAPSNYDALSYRTPQLLHWLSEGGWHWIVTPNSRMNISSPGFNWLAAPLLFLTNTDRFFFLVNTACYSLLPGVVFEMFWRAGISKRVAWYWMWLTPAAYVFAVQAGSIGNDLTGTLYAVASIAFALRARDNGRVSDLGLSLLAVAMCTGIKNSNLPILLPWVVALGPGWRLFAAKPMISIAIIFLAALASCLPTTVLNVRETGHWTGDPHDEQRVRQPSLWVGAASNTVELTIANLQPPVWPIAQRTNNVFNQFIDTLGLREFCKRSPRFEAKWYEVPSEESAGIGLGLVVMAGISSAGVVFFHRGGTFPSGSDTRRRNVGIASLFAALVPVCLVSSEGLPRMVSVFVPSALILILLGAANQRFVRSRAWNCAAVAMACFPIPALVLSAARPLFPHRLLFAERADGEKEGGARARARRVYSVYATRPDAFAPLRDFLPIGTREIGLIAFGDEPETSLWRPFGSVRVNHLITEDDWQLGSPIIASDPVCRARFGQNPAEFASARGLIISGSAEITLRVSSIPERWYVLTPNQ